MSISNSSSARITGFKINDAAIKDAAAIDMAKIGSRTLYIPLPANAFAFSGTSVAMEADGIFNVINFPNANTANIYTSVRCPKQYVSGPMVVSILWKSAGVSGNVKFSAAISCNSTDGPTAAEETLTVTTAVSATAGQVNKSQITTSVTTFLDGQLIGLNISRDPADAADTLASDVKVIGVYLEYTGRG